MKKNKVGGSILKRNCKRVICMSLVLLILLVGCSVNDEIRENIDIVQKKEMEEYDEIKDSIESWIGDYTFSEFVEPNINMFYSIMIYKMNDGIYADIFVDGLQRLERVKANVKGDGDLIEISFLEYLPDNLMELYEEDDILLALEKKDSVIYTSWGVIQPISPENNELGIYFVEVEE